MILDRKCKECGNSVHLDEDDKCPVCSFKPLDEKEDNEKTNVSNEV